MTRRSAAVAVAAGALILAVTIKSTGQAPADVTTRTASARPAVPKSQAKAELVAPKPSAKSPAKAELAAPQPSAKVAAKAQLASAEQFTAATKSLFEETCSECHNSTDLAGGLDVSLYTSVESLAAERDRWDLILTKLKSQEMPPEDVLRPDHEINTLVKFLETEFARADAAMKPDPGRVSARRLNRAEYTNTIRDLLAIEFRADKNFPTDDSGDGFDNIADVLTVSPVLMEKYCPLPRGSPSGRSRPGRCRSRLKWSTACASRTSAGSIPATSRRRTASISTPTISSRLDYLGSARKTRRPSPWACGWTES